MAPFLKYDLSQELVKIDVTNPCVTTFVDDDKWGAKAFGNTRNTSAFEKAFPTPDEKKPGNLRDTILEPTSHPFRGSDDRYGAVASHVGVVGPGAPLTYSNECADVPRETLVTIQNIQCTEDASTPLLDSSLLKNCYNFDPFLKEGACFKTDGNAASSLRMGGFDIPGMHKKDEGLWKDMMKQLFVPKSSDFVNTVYREMQNAYSQCIGRGTDHQTCVGESINAAKKYFDLDSTELYPRTLQQQIMIVHMLELFKEEASKTEIARNYCTN